MTRESAAKAAYLSPNQLRVLEDLFFGRIKRPPGFSGSVSKNILKKTKQNVHAFFAANTFRVDELELDHREIADLESKHLIAFKNRDEDFVLTLKTIILMEYELYDTSGFRPNVDRLLDDVNYEFFEKSVKTFETPLVLKEKAVIITLLGLGAICKEYPLRIEKQYTNSIRKAVDAACQFLATFQRDSTEACSKLWTDVIGEDPVIFFFRRLNKIQGRTDGIYVYDKKAHFLDLLHSNGINEKTLHYLLKKVFIEPLDFDKKQRLIEALEIIGKERFYVFDGKAPYDFNRVSRAITDSIEDFFVER